jgi:hypothetical protein
VNSFYDVDRTMPRLRAVFIVCISMCCLLAPSVARAGEPQCSRTVIHDWYQDGRIQGQYRVSCYRAALSDVPADKIVYGTLRRDLSQALSSVINRVKQQGITAGPQTLLAAPQPTKSAKSHSWLYVVVLAFLLVMLIFWCVARWRGSHFKGAN